MTTAHSDARTEGPAVPVGTPEQARAIKALADPVRLRLLALLAAAPPGGICVCDVVTEFDLSQPTISHHLKLLREAGLVDSYRKGTWAYYSMQPGALAPLRELLDGLDAVQRQAAATG